MDSTAAIWSMPRFDISPKKTDLVLDVGDFRLPSKPPARFEGWGVLPEDPRFTFLGSPHAVSGDITPLSLDLATYRAFQNQDQIVDGWNGEILMLMKQSDQKKRGELKIGVELPRAVASILGEGGAGLKVNGYRRILFSGRSQWSDVANVAAVRQSKFPSLKMDQISSFTVEGTIGSKVFVKVDQDSKRQTDLENRIQIRYKGDEDDILQTVEAGNTTLSLPNTQFVGYSQRIQGLFGLKATAQLGPVDLTVITSQEKGNSVRNRFSAGANVRNIILRDFQYAHNRFFDLGRVRDSNDTILQFWEPGDKINTIRLYTYTGYTENQSNIQDQKGIAYADVRDTAREDFSQFTTEGRWKELGLDNLTSFMYNADSFYVFFPVANSQISSSAIAYYMEISKRDGTVDTIGRRPAAGTFTLQILKPRNLIPEEPFWEAEWKNVYDLTVRDLDYDLLDLRIYKGQRGTENDISSGNLDEQDGIRYLRLFGLDGENGNGQPIPDDRIDLNDAILDRESGLLIFPNRRPFDPPPDARYVVGDTSAVLIEKVPEIYTTQNQTELTNATKYYLTMTSRSVSRKINLGQIGIMPESEVVTLNGQKLVRGAQYTIQYDFGEVTLADNVMLTDQSDLTIDYEYAPFLSAEKKTLFGIRSEYAPGPNFNTGATFLYKGSKATDRPAQLGQEPFRDLVFDYDVSYKAQPAIFTRMVDALPFVETEAKSNLSIAAEIARSMPNPNTRGEVFVDDFESTRQPYPLGILRESYTFASPPLDPNNSYSPRPARGFQDKGFKWYNPFGQIPITEIYDREIENSSNNRTHVLVLDFNPHLSRLKDSIAAPEERWAGIVRGLPKSEYDQTQAEFLEIRMKINGEKDSLGVLHIDLGKINEDVDLDDNLDSEDKDNNGVLEDSEDIGLDGRTDQEERDYYGDDYPGTSDDPEGDNWSFDRDKEYELDGINGTEGNSVDALNGRADTEDIGGATGFDRINSYYSFAIDLANPDPDVLVEGSDWPEGSGEKGWRTYRIPVWNPEFYDVVHPPSANAPDPINIQYVRLWLDGARGPTKVSIAAIDMIENRWKGDVVLASEIVPDSGAVLDSSSGILVPTGGWVVSAAGMNRAEDPTFLVAVVNDEVNTDYKNDRPPGVVGHEDKTRGGVREKEQSISFTYDKFLPGDTGRALSTDNLAKDFTGYKFLRMFVHGDALADGKTDFYLKFGQSEQVYYYYRAPVEQGWTPNTIAIDLDQLTVFKETSRRSVPDSVFKAGVFDSVSHFGVRGLASLSRVSYMEMGLIRTGDETDTPFGGEVWCDELRLTDVRRDVGTAGRVSVTTQFADLFGVTASASGQNYAFRSLNAGRSGSVRNASSQLRTDVRGSMSVHRLFTSSNVVSLPVNVNYTKDLRKPKLLTGSDVVLSDSLRDVERTESVTEGVSTQIRLNLGDHWLLKSTVGGLTGSFSATRRRGQSPVSPGDTATSYSASADYKIQFRERLSFPALFWTRFLAFPKRVHQTPFSLLPTDFSADGTVSRTKSIRVTISGANRADTLLTNNYIRNFKGRAQLGLSPIPAVRVTYSMNTARDLSDPELVDLSLSPSAFRLGRELQFSQRVSADYRPLIFSWLAPNFSYSADFNDQIDNTHHDHDVGITRRWSAGWTFDPDKFLTSMAFGRSGPGARGGGRSTRGKPKPEPEPDPDKKDDKRKTDSTKTQAPKDQGSGFGPIDAWRGLIRGFRFVTSPVSPITVSYSRQNGDTRRSLVDRPDLGYRFGLNLHRGEPFETIEQGNNSVSRVDAYTESESFSLKNNFTFTKFLTISSSYQKAIGRREQVGTEPNHSESVSFPNLSTGFGQLERLPVLKWLFVNASAKIAYSAKNDKSYIGDQKTVANTDNTTKGFSPLLSFTGNTKKGVRVTYAMDQTETESRPSSGSASIRTAASQRMSLDYTFRSPNGIPIPFLRRLRLKSQMTVSLQISRRVNETLTLTNGSYKPTQQSDEFGVSPRANYSFSSRVKGGLSAQWTDSTTDSGGAKRKNHIRELGIWVEFYF